MFVYREKSTSKKRNTIFFFIFLITLLLIHLMFIVCGVAQLYSVADARYLLSKPLLDIKMHIKIPDNKPGEEVNYINQMCGMLGFIGSIAILISMFIIGVILFIGNYLGFLPFVPLFIATYGIVVMIFGGIFFLFIFVIAYSGSFSRFSDTDYVVLDITPGFV
jgi:hypothetical protein